MKKKLFALVAIIVLVVYLIIWFTPYRSSIDLPNELSTISKVSTSMTIDSSSEEIELDMGKNKKIIDIINHVEYQEFKGAGTRRGGKVYSINIWIKSSNNTSNTSNIDIRTTNFPIYIYIYEDDNKQQKYSFIQFHDIRKDKIMSFKLDAEQIKQLYNLLKTEV